MNKKSKCLLAIFLVSFLLYAVLSPLRMLKMESATISNSGIFICNLYSLQNRFLA